MNDLDGLWILLAGFIGFGAGLALSAKSFAHAIATKADTGIRLESAGRLYTIHSVCVCGAPLDESVVHRTDAPCYVKE